MKDTEIRKRAEARIKKGIKRMKRGENIETSVKKKKEKDETKKRRLLQRRKLNLS